MACHSGQLTSRPARVWRLRAMLYMSVSRSMRRSRTAIQYFCGQGRQLRSMRLQVLECSSLQTGVQGCDIWLCSGIIDPISTHLFYLRVLSSNPAYLDTLLVNSHSVAHSFDLATPRLETTVEKWPSCIFFRPIHSSQGLLLSYQHQPRGRCAHRAARQPNRAWHAHWMTLQMSMTVSDGYCLIERARHANTAS